MKKQAKSTMGRNLDSRPVFAAILASLVVFAFGVTYHTLGARLEAPANALQTVPEALERLPMVIADWTGEDRPMDEAVVRATGTDTHVNRRYSRKDGLESVGLFIGVNASVFERAIHRPEICYTRTGWTLVNRRSSDLLLATGVKLPYSIFQFSRGDLKREEAVVLHYYIVDGQYYEEVFPLQAKLWRLGGGAAYIARVMIVAPVEISSRETAQRLVSSFAADSAPFIADLFARIQEDRNLYSTGPPRDKDGLQ